MPSLSAREFEKSLPQAIQRARIVVLFGDNIQVKADLFRLIRKSLDIQADDPFRLVQLDSEAIDAGPARLGDELGAISMFGGSRLIRVVATSKQAEGIVDLAGAAPEGDWLLVVDTDAFALAGSRTPNVVVVECASEKAGDFHAFVRSEFERSGVLLEDGVLEFLIPLLGEDRAAARGEVEKLALLTGANAVSLDDVRNVVADASTLVADEIAVAALSGDMSSLGLALNRLGTTGSDATSALGAASRLALASFRGRANQWRGRPDQVMQNFSLTEMRSILRSLQSAVLQTRSDGANAALIAERALISVGNAVRARRR